MNDDILKSCILCPRRCRVDRTSGYVGYCKASDKIKIARNALHYWEEPSISGTNGSGTVFFSYCNLGCIFCQNYKISREHSGKFVDVSELADIFIDLQKQKAHNINLVTPTHYIPEIAKALRLAKERGLNIPVVYNCGGYETVEGLKLLDGLIDIYMPDMKYYNNKYSVKYSNAPDYFNCCKTAIAEMYRHVGKNVFDSNGLMKRGVIVRHMMLPGLLFDSKKIIDYLYREYGNDIYISIMNQYTPVCNLDKYPELNKTVSSKYYNTLVDYAVRLGIENAYIQEGETALESFIPEFYNED